MHPELFGPTGLANALSRDGFSFVQAEGIRPILEAAGLRDWEAFAETWNDLGVDTFMADGGRYRRRRFAAFASSSDGLARKAHQPHYQSRDYNPLNGGVARWFEPITDEVAEHPAMQAILTTCHRLFDGLTPEETRPPVWHVEVHQFRIETSPDHEGKPTPEGMHRDGVDWVMVMLVKRENIASGKTMMEDVAHRPIGSFTLTQPMDVALVDDDRVFHGVTALSRLHPEKLAYRDVLVVTFRRA
ncbi:hypothetical protein AKJ09_02563 [Labilithrix luteola]|uniref:2OG-Fe dioxygenase family protein n=1 Tax=Labilithrix luteola TaxID=1391654 RepID=A0A0K1PRZ8_9BACT|nr:2OG-Fe dioxygenase family protein [Labilithrix luteola]AKU95899.1 hypothetical protein AKJ09_02563 [Labilithrix luteola]